MSEGSVTEIVCNRDRLCQFLVKSQSTCNGGAYRFNVGNVLHSCADVVVIDIEKDLCFMLKTAVGT